jgi:dinuclear metal center YbgI/SA1388 family protein
MLIEEIDTYFRKILQIGDLEKIDLSLNGVQVGRPEQKVDRAAFAVDASMETFKRAADGGANLLFVHHGLFWGKVLPICRNHYQRINFLIERDLSLYAVHLPLDMHPDIGNNAGIANALALMEIVPSMEYKGINIGYKGRFAEPRKLEEIVRDTFGGMQNVLGVLPFGKESIETVGIVSGGAPYQVEDAIADGLDLYITGDASHGIYHQCLEAGINVIFGGHYSTETWGVRLLSDKFSRETGVPSFFIDVPTGL